MIREGVRRSIIINRRRIVDVFVGGRWFWNDKWGIYLELGGGSTQGATGGLGLTMKL